MSQDVKIVLRNGRGDRIRTYDLLVPNQALYQAKLHPEEVQSMGEVSPCQRYALYYLKI